MNYCRCDINYVLTWESNHDTSLISHIKNIDDHTTVKKFINSFHNFLANTDFM